MTEHPAQAPLLAARLLAGLGRFRAAEASGVLPQGRGLFSYCALRRERLLAVDLPLPLVGVVLAGRKEVWRGDTVEAFEAGTLFVLPARVPMDVLNLPGERRGSYQSLIVEVRPEDLPDLEAPTGSGAAALSVRLSEGLVDAVLRAAADLATDPTHGPARTAVRSARLTELLALLHSVPAGRALFDRSVAERVARLVRGDLARGWSAAEVARDLGLSESTMRRRLAAEGARFALILRRERMQAAARRIAAGDGSQAAGLAVGYASRAHFARHYRAAFGASPAARSASS